MTKALQFQTRNGGQLEQILVRMGALSSEFLPAYYAEIYELEQLDDDALQQLLDNDGHWQQLQEQLDRHLLSACLEHACVPVQLEGEQLRCACTNPSQASLLKFVANQQQPAVDLVLVGEDNFNQLQSRLQQESENTATSAGLTMLEEDRLREMASEAPTVNLLNNLIAKALRRRASDMHIEPWKGKGRVRYRIDGVLHEADFIPTHMVLPMVTRLKLLSSMDLASSYQHESGVTLEEYIKRAGGMRQKADDERVYIVKANGSVVVPERRSWFSSGSRNQIEPGDTIVAPMDTQYMNNIEMWTTATQIMYQVGVALAALSGL